ncbi:MAG: protein-export chaperone SecB, partial [Alphaproteobacteria bacterium]
MAEDEKTTEGAAEQAKPPRLQVLGQFIRDLSFENIAAQQGVSGEVQPDINIAVNLDARKRPVENQFEVSMKLKATARNKVDEKTLYIVEMDYVGIFNVENVPAEQLHPFLLIECPRMLFPFVRRIVSDLTQDGGFPALNLETIDFVGLYRAELAR